MTNLALSNLLIYYAFFAAIVANASLVVFVADRLTPKAADAAPAHSFGAGNENVPVGSVKLAA